jgi:hypothetical protein
MSQGTVSKECMMQSSSSGYMIRMICNSLQHKEKLSLKSEVAGRDIESFLLLQESNINCNHKLIKNQERISICNNVYSDDC